MTHDEMIAVIQAHKEGKVIQSDRIDNEGKQIWIDDNNPNWNFGLRRYRVKPEKRVGYVNVYPTRVGWCRSKHDADSTASRDRIACIRVEYTEGQFDE